MGKRNAITESIVNTASGFVLSVVVGLIVFPMFGYVATVPKLTGITAIYSVVSVCRNYLIRRMFQRRESK